MNPLSFYSRKALDQAERGAAGGLVVVVPDHRRGLFFMATDSVGRGGDGSGGEECDGQLALLGDLSDQVVRRL